MALVVLKLRMAIGLGDRKFGEGLDLVMAGLMLAMFLNDVAKGLAIGR